MNVFKLIDRGNRVLLVAALTFAVLLSACSSDDSSADDDSDAQGSDEVSFELKTAADSDGLAFIGVGGEIDGVRNPELAAPAGAAVTVTLENGDGSEHDISFPEFDATSDRISEQGSTTTVEFTADGVGTSQYFCTLTGHRQAGMEGDITVSEDGADSAGGDEEATAADIVRGADDLPTSSDTPPLGRRFDLRTVELEGQLADDTTYEYWTFQEKVPGPFLRVKQNETVELHLANPAESRNTHSIDLHAVTGPGGGATVTQVAPGEEKMFTFKALNPGLYIYHCATPSVAHHMTNGMYGLVLVEPEGGLAPVDHEFYVVQGEIYTAAAFGEKGKQEFSQEKMLAEDPEYHVFNGAVGALSVQKPLKANVGETVRIFFGVGGPNSTSSFHVIGEIFDRVFDQASLTSAPLTNVQTTTVAPGGATMVEFKLEVPGRYLLVDHALSRLERGLVGFLEVAGAENPEIFHGEAGGDAGGH